MDWKNEILVRLQKRDASEMQLFVNLITYNHKLLDNANSLREENVQLRIENEKLRKDLRTGNSGESGRIQMLEQKMLLQQEELTSLHKRRGEYTQQLVDLTSQLQEKDKIIAEKNATVAELKSGKNVLLLEVSRCKTAISDLDALNQTIRDEYTALQLACNALDERVRKLQDENASVLERLMTYKRKDVEKLNEENESFVRRRQAAIQKELEEAAKDNTRTVSPDRSPCLASVPMTVIPSRVTARVEAHDGEVNAVRWSPVDRIFATGGADRKVKLWEVSKGGNCETKGVLVGSNAGVMSVDFNSTGSLLLAASNDFASRVWSMVDQRMRHTLTGHSKNVMAAKFLGEAPKVVSGSHDRTLKIWDLKSGACIETKFAGSSCNDLVTSDSIGSTIISGHFDKKIRFWDIRAESSASDIVLNGKVTSLDLSKDSNYLLSCVRDDTLILLDLRVNKIINTFSADGFKVGCDWTRATFSPDAQHIAAGSSDGCVYVWNVNSVQVEAVLKEHSSAVTAVAWLPFSTVLASVDKSRRAIVWGDV